eukprot:397898-Hanusia_phi.AAC.2
MKDCAQKSDKVSGTRFVIYPRKRGVRNESDKPAVTVIPKRFRKPVVINASRIRELFHLTQIKAAKEIGVSLTTLKTVCRRLGIMEWGRAKGKRKSSKGKARAEKTVSALGDSSSSFGELERKQESLDQVPMKFVGKSSSSRGKLKRKQESLDQNPMKFVRKSSSSRGKLERKQE